MQLKKIVLENFRNLEKVELDLQEPLIALVGFNSSGKSNIYHGIVFALSFARANTEGRQKLRSEIWNKPAFEESTGDFFFYFQVEDEEEQYGYSLRFAWNGGEAEEKWEGGTREEIQSLIQRFSLAAVTDIGNWQVDFSPHPMKDSLLDEDSRLRYRLYDLATNYPERFELLKDSFISLFPNTIDLKADRSGVTYSEEHHAGPFPLAIMGSGQKKILRLLVSLACSTERDFGMIFFESAENSIHPILVQNLLISLSVLSGNIRILLTSHSPHFIDHFPLERIYLTTSDRRGRVVAKKIRDPKKMYELAGQYEQSIGAMLFNLMIEAYYDPEKLRQWL